MGIAEGLLGVIDEAIRAQRIADMMARQSSQQIITVVTDGGIGVGVTTKTLKMCPPGYGAVAHDDNGDVACVPIECFVRENDPSAMPQCYSPMRL